MLVVDTNGVNIFISTGAAPSLAELRPDERRPVTFMHNASVNTAAAVRRRFDRHGDEVGLSESLLA